ncbi:hypothetical protein LCGC14_2740530 [marine sediment metagenome]|uniref:Uncharacterized protein n=1 Tax=marine sediment metagenome TaxID=412755 RepID=A0A0F9BDG2_9ZZZZ
MVKEKSVHDLIEDIFLKRNPKCDREDLNWRIDGRLEWLCEHSIGHTVFTMDEHWTHGCDGCCDLVTFSIKFNVPKDEN